MTSSIIQSHWSDKNTVRHKHLWRLKIKTQDRQAGAYLTKLPLYGVWICHLLLSPTCPIFPCSCWFIGLKMGAGPSITSNISVSNLMRRCEWILKQAGEAPGEACAGPPGPAAGLNKYAAEQTCRQLGLDTAAAVCVVALRVAEEKAAGPYCVSWEMRRGKVAKWHLKRRYMWQIMGFFYCLL